ncbi:nitroreductase, partial [Dehalococcoidia bacterium]|nr:nitroreductase [Dehalococcoidia bacterium]
GLGTVIVGAFRDRAVQDILGTELTPLYIMPVGRRG